MNMSTKDLKEALYVGETLFGIFLLALAVFAVRSALEGNDALYNLIPALALVLAGLICIIFGIATFCLRNDPEIWL